MKATRDTDRGSVLLMVLVVSVTLSVVVATLAGFAAGTLRYGGVTESRADRLAAAQGAMDDAIERLELKRSLCSTSASSDPLPINPEFPPINGVTASVTCEVVSGEVPPADGWAIVVTGEGATGPGLSTNAGGNPRIEGPIYVFDAGTVSLSKPTTIVKGDLWHRDDACAGGSFARSNVNIPMLAFDPTTRGTYCTNKSWQQLFDEPPPVPSGLASLPLAAPPLDDGPQEGECKVFFPGRYTTANPIELDDNNYFRSGNYFFDNIGLLELQGEQATFGDVAPETDFVYPLLSENDTEDTCREERILDESTGATVYLGGNSRIRAAADSGFEISRRQQGNFWVSLHVLDSSSSFTIIASEPGGSKDIALNGLVWAPYSRISFGTVSAKKDAAIRGGAVVAMFEGTISNSPGGGFLIKVPTSEQSIKLLLESTAVDDRGSTSVRVVADWRPTSGALAVNSWRVAN